jgi:hypothetical protein
MRNPFKRAKKNPATRTIQDEKRHNASNTAAGPSETGTNPTVTEGKLLVMGRESTFSGEVVDYAIDMARRMSFEILALNSTPLSCDSFSLFSTPRSKLCQEFQTISEENAAAFRHAAEANGIPFTHVVKFDEPETALSSVQREHENIEFVISEAQPQSAADRATESNRPQSEILVYSMI